MRLLAREVDGAEELFCDEGLDFVSKFAFPSNKIKEKFSIQIESAKCLVNLVFKSSALNVAMRNPEKYRAIISVLDDPDILPEVAFPYLRILFLISRPVEGNKLHRQLADEKAIPIIFNLIKKIVDSPSFPNPSHFQTLQECFQVLFGLTIEMGTLNKSESPMKYEDYVPNYEEVVTTLLKVFNVPLEHPKLNIPLYEVKRSIINCFINIPLQYYRILVVLNDSEQTLKNLFDCLEYDLRQPESDKTNVVTACMVVQCLLHQAPETREYAMKRMFPGRNLEAERNQAEEEGIPINMDAVDKDADTIGNRIIKLMTSVNMAIKYVTNELLFSLVGESADDFVRLTGFGNAAGLLAMRNLFGMGKHLDRDTATEIRQNTKKEKLPDLRPAKEGETEEEAEDRIMENFEKMVDAGVIKLVKKDEPPKDNK
eukprot:TRINITY_DN2796_c0_g3_i2.p1 TRINITY_DN2796_c0_g3~~TRINITY_DN2796_c0_g3_i2.p1  ORF type:complete len:427 (+),score=83.57 TRINITY_DN2796_c0_g3_i2:802-2082(+)